MTSAKSGVRNPETKADNERDTLLAEINLWLRAKQEVRVITICPLG